MTKHILFTGGSDAGFDYVFKELVKLDYFKDNRDFKFVPNFEKEIGRQKKEEIGETFDAYNFIFQGEIRKEIFDQRFLFLEYLHKTLIDKNIPFVFHNRGLFDYLVHIKNPKYKGCEWTKPDYYDKAISTFDYDYDLIFLFIQNRFQNMDLGILNSLFITKYAERRVVANNAGLDKNELIKVFYRGNECSEINERLDFIIKKIYKKFEVKDNFLGYNLNAL